MNEISFEHGYAVIIAGGAGTRLWPISRKSRPKQFKSFTTETTLLQQMVGLAEKVLPRERILVIATPEFASVIQEQLPELPKENLLFEPARRDNGPAIALAMLQVNARDPQAVAALLWCDHNITDADGFAQMLQACFKAAAEYPKMMVMVGAKPTHPDTGLGYIQMGKELASYDEIPLFKVKRFTEKPDLATATRYVSSWEYLWNVGYKIMASAEYLRFFRELHPELHEALDAITEGIAHNDQAKIAEAYEAFPKLSDEFLFTQYMSDLLVIPADIGWSDIGNWQTLHEVLREAKNNALVTRGNVIALESKNSLIFAKDRPIAVCGLDDIVVVDEGDAILVMSKSCASRMKELTQLIEQSNPELL